ncbi:hypothetical protein BD779DRAFT_1529993, partial [Infundibulicybe gibba]
KERKREKHHPDKCAGHPQRHTRYPDQLHPSTDRRDRDTGIARNTKSGMRRRGNKNSQSRNGR